MTTIVSVRSGRYTSTPSRPRRASFVSTSSRPTSASSASIIWLLRTGNADTSAQSRPLVSRAPAGRSRTGGACSGVCTAEKLTVAIHGLPAGRRLIHSIASSTGTVPRKLRARRSVSGTRITAPSSRLMTSGET